MKLTNLGHSAFLFEGKDISFITDPYQDNSVPGLRLSRLSVNYVFCSHDHFDHNAKELIKIIPSNKKVHYDVITTFHDREGGTKRGLNDMYLFEVDGYRILHAGDLGCIPNDEILRKMMNVDILLAPINGFYTISADELAAIVHITKPRIVIPMHYQNVANNSGYPDGGQIEKFKKFFPNYKEVKGNSIEVNDELFKNSVYIFNEALQEK